MPKVSKKKRKLKILLTLLIVVVLISLGVILYFDKIVNPVIIITSESQVKNMASKAVNSSIADILANNDIYDELVTTTLDNFGKISMIHANTHKVNSLSKEISNKALLQIEKIGNQGVKIPLGTFSGMPLFAGKGPEVVVKVAPIGTLDVFFKSKFTQAGINQTLHRIYLDVRAYVNLLMPLFGDVVATYTEVMICESVIVGQVPEFYFNNAMDSLLDLVPDR